MSMMMTCVAAQLGFLLSVCCRLCIARAIALFALQWTWMTCTEFSYFQTADPSDPNCPFSPLMDEASQVKLCQDAFSPVMDANFLAVSLE